MVKFRNLPPVTLFIGLPGSGKTTCAASLTRQAIRKKVPVYSNVPIIGAYKLSKSDIGKYDLDNSLIIIDEAGLEFDNRDFDKTFKGADGKAMLEWLKLVRHHKARIVFFSQTVDIDLKIRSLAGLIYLVRPSLLPFFTVMHRVRRSIDVSDDSHTLCDRLTLPTPFMRLFSARLFRPLYYRYFDSYACEQLPAKAWETYTST